MTHLMIASQVVKRTRWVRMGLMVKLSVCIAANRQRHQNKKLFELTKAGDVMIRLDPLLQAKRDGLI